jgi:sulfate permease, SulP family
MEGNTPSRLEQLLRTIQLPTLISGLTIGFTEVIIALSLASLIFAGKLESLLSRGIGLMLITGVVHLIFSACFSSVKSIVGSIQDQPATLTAVSAAVVAASLSNETSRAATVFVLIFITALLVGISVILLGIFKLGGLVRYIPYPVIGGFIAGVGWLLAQGSIGAMADYPLTPDNFSNLLESDQIILWLPGVIFGVVLFWGVLQTRNALALPGLLIAGIVVFFCILVLSGTSIDNATEKGLLLGDSGSVAKWQPLSLDELRELDSEVLFGQAGNIGAILTMTVISLLLNVSGMEVGMRRDIDLNHELRVVGIANLLSGLLGGMIGYPALSLTSLNQRIGLGNRLSSMIAGLFCLFVLVVGTSSLAYAPKFLLGGLLLFLGLDFLYDWVVNGFRRLGWVDYAAVIAILVIIAIWGFLAGVGIGLVVMVLLFVLSSSRVDVFRSALNGDEVFSYVLRNAREQRTLADLRYSIFVLELQGYMFFGTANSVLRKVYDRLEDTEKQQLQYLILDFRHVVGLDSSAAYSFAKVNYLAETYGFQVIFTRLNPIQLNLLSRSQVTTGKHLFENINEALQWCEDNLLTTAQQADSSMVPDLASQLADYGFRVEDAALLKPYLERVALTQGDVLMREGEKATDLYFVETGQVSAYANTRDGHSMRVQTVPQGSMVGELGFFLEVPRTASVIADVDSILYRLTQGALSRMTNDNPVLAVSVNQLMGRLLSTRLVAANRERAARGR